MRSTSLSVSLSVVMFMISSVCVFAQSGTPEKILVVSIESTEIASLDRQFDTLDGVRAVPMASRELEKVKGQHVHFRNPGSGKTHFAGNPNNNGIGAGNWYLNGSPDGEPVAPSYHGLCVAGPIIIPTGPNPSQCP